MKSILLGLATICITVSCFADVHKFKGSDGSALLTNRKPEIRSGVNARTATTADLKPSSESKLDDNVNYVYEGTKKIVPTTETVKLGARDVYRRGWCKINNSIVPCYNYEKTLPATSFQIETSKSVAVTPEKVLQESIKNTSKKEK